MSCLLTKPWGFAMATMGILIIVYAKGCGGGKCGSFLGKKDNAKMFTNNNTKMFNTILWLP